ncbi:MAG TPA: flagellar hook-length control protein FliK [Paracoccus sp.]|nr:flagellar hook-length control protein FliK [Paracoccus sp. (in: a-proteobacteria)]
MRSTIDTARHAAQQIAARAVDLGHGRFELSLSPTELGKVDMLLQDGENRLTLFINAERPETMELIRRHISLLEQELRQMGLGTLSLQLGNGGSADAGPGHGSGPQRDTQDAELAPPLPPARPPQRVTGDHLDLRM